MRAEVEVVVAALLRRVSLLPSPLGVDADGQVAAVEDAVVLYDGPHLAAVAVPPGLGGGGVDHGAVGVGKLVGVIGLLLRAVSVVALRQVSPGLDAEPAAWVEVHGQAGLEGQVKAVLVVVGVLTAEHGLRDVGEGLAVLPRVLAHVVVVGREAQIPVVLVERRLDAFGAPGVLVGEAAELLAAGFGASPVVLRITADAPGARLAVGGADVHVEGVAVGEVVEVGRRAVVFRGIGAGLGLAVPFVHEARLDDDVEHLPALTVVHARQFGDLTFLLIRLDVLHRLSGQQADELVVRDVASVHLEVHLLVHEEEFAVADAHARQLGEQRGHAFALFQVEGLRIEYHRVAAHGEALGARLDLGLAQEHVREGQADVAHVDGVVAAGDVIFLLKLVVPEVGDFDGEFGQELHGDGKAPGAVHLSLF